MWQLHVKFVVLEQNDKRIALLKNRQADIDRHLAFEHEWQREDEEFIAYTKNVIEKKILAGNSVVPLRKTVKVSIV